MTETINDEIICTTQTSLDPEAKPFKNVLITSDYSNQYFESLIICGDAKDELKKFPDNYFQCCITSPPYWGLRDYGIPRQIGAEPSLDDYINNLVDIFRELRRTLCDDGTLWLNIGDSYTSGNRTWRDPDKKNPARGMNYRPPTPSGLKSKDLIGVPWRLAFALQSDGWFLRSDIIWYKPNCQPESVKDRPTRSHEYLFLLTKSDKYLYNYNDIMEPSTDGRGLRNRRTVWSIKTEPFKYAHFAVFPEELIKPCILGGSNRGDMVLDPFFGSGTVGIVGLKLNRRFVGIELNPEFIEIARRRFIEEHLSTSPLVKGYHCEGDI
ncbi:MAG: site-specific DNA-methyltransferase [Methanothrix sp.]|nr:site-specific DNA-methyltransferase [Methanothrix sp.]